MHLATERNTVVQVIPYSVLLENPFPFFLLFFFLFFFFSFVVSLYQDPEVTICTEEGESRWREEETA
jgi:hypothetical protein